MLESLTVWSVVAVLAGLAYLARRYPDAFSRTSKRVMDLAGLVLVVILISSYMDLRFRAQILQDKLLADSTATLGSAAATIDAMNHSARLLKAVIGVAFLVIVTLGFLQWHGRRMNRNETEVAPDVLPDS